MLCVHACVLACVYAYVQACVHACVHTCVCDINKKDYTIHQLSTCNWRFVCFAFCDIVLYCIRLYDTIL